MKFENKFIVPRNLPDRYGEEEILVELFTEFGYHLVQVYSIRTSIKMKAINFRNSINPAIPNTIHTTNILVRSIPGRIPTRMNFKTWLKSSLTSYFPTPRIFYPSMSSPSINFHVKSVLLNLLNRLPCLTKHRPLTSASGVLSRLCIKSCHEFSNLGWFCI